jgi:hypothetical protein
MARAGTNDLERMLGEARRDLQAAGRALNEARARRDAALQHYQTLRNRAAAQAEGSQSPGPKPDGLYGSYIGDAPPGLGMFIGPAETESQTILIEGDEDHD